MVTSIRPTSALVVIAALVAAGCSGADDAADETSAPAAPAAATTVPTTTTPTDPPTSAVATTAPTTPATSTPVTSTPATTAPPTSAPTPPETTAPTEWTPVDDSPYDVGVTTVIVDDPTGERPMTVDVWFPLADDVEPTTLARQQYTLLPGVYFESPDAFAATPELLRVDDSYPLVVYSHGSGGIRYLHSSYTEALASHGYVVVAPDHTGNTVLERFTGDGPSGDVIAFERPDDVRLVIDAFVDPDHPVAGPWASVVDAERIAVTGHSFGGYTAIAMATGVTTSLGEIAPDDRVDAIVPLAPASGANLLPDDRIASLDVPMMVVVGTNDRTTPVDPNVTRLWDLADNAPAYRVELVAGAHQTFTDLCAYRDFLPTLDDVPEIITTTIEEFGQEGCSPGDIDAERAADLTNTFVLQFLDQVFRDGPPIDLAAAPSDVIVDAR